MTQFWMLTWPIAGRTAQVAKLCEATGWDGLLVTDTQCLAAEAIVQLSFCAAATQRIGLGTGDPELIPQSIGALSTRVLPALR